MNSMTLKTMFAKSIFAIVLIGLSILGTNDKINAQKEITPADPEFYAMDREHIAFEDEHVILINYRGSVSPRQYSVTQFTNVQFLPISSSRYEFNLNFFDKNTQRLIEDDVPTKWKSWIDDSGSYDPLGSNFRPNSPSIMVTQEKRNIRYVDHFPYLPQNPRIDIPEQDRSSMPLEISAGAGMEAIVFGTFGVKIEQDKL